VAQVLLGATRGRVPVMGRLVKDLVSTEYFHFCLIVKY
jgi:hypothetical protein